MATVLLLAAAPFFTERVWRAEPSQSAAASAPIAPPRLAEFGSETVSNDVREFANWVAQSRDNARLAFVIIDKKTARAHVFNGAARLLDSSPVLIGAAHGDDSVPGIGTRPIAQVKHEEKTTPAGRFVAEPGLNASGEDVVWIDYDAAVSMHRVRLGNPKERRLERMASSSVAEHRISYGCVNVPAAFYDRHIRPALAGTQPGIVYVLPEIKSVQQVFGSYPTSAITTAGTDDDPPNPHR